MRPVFFSFLLFSILIDTGCNRLEGKSFVPSVPGHPESGRRMVILQKALREISGIAYISPDSLAAINDETGKLFFVNPRTGSFQSYEFGKKGDYEEVVIAGDYYYILRSDGHIYQVSKTDFKLVNEFSHDFGKRAEFESMYYDKAKEKLVLICKECGSGADYINGYQFDLVTRQYVPGVYFTIEWRDIRTMAKNNQIECKPSAAAINPVNQKLFIIASVGKVLLQCSQDGVLERVYAINAYHFQQPEGITFATDGSMYISNEASQGKATILYFPYKQ